MRPSNKKKPLPADQRMYEVGYHADTGERLIQPIGGPAVPGVWPCGSTPPMADMEAAERWADAWEQLGQKREWITEETSKNMLELLALLGVSTTAEALTRVRDSQRLVSSEPTLAADEHAAETPQEQVQIADMYQQAGDGAELQAMLAAEPIYTALVVDGEFVRARVFWSPAAADAYCKGAEDVHEDAQAWLWPWAHCVEEAYDDGGAVHRVCVAAVEKLQGNEVGPELDES